MRTQVWPLSDLLWGTAAHEHPWSQLRAQGWMGRKAKAKLCDSPSLQEVSARSLYELK